VGFFYLMAAMAMTVFAYFSNVGCDPLLNGDVSNPNQVLLFRYQPDDLHID